jgi:hypothetical protein
MIHDDTNFIKTLLPPASFGPHPLFHRHPQPTAEVIIVLHHTCLSPAFDKGPCCHWPSCLIVHCPLTLPPCLILMPNMPNQRSYTKRSSAAGGANRYILPDRETSIQPSRRTVVKSYRRSRSGMELMWGLSCRGKVVKSLVLTSAYRLLRVSTEEKEV